MVITPGEVHNGGEGLAMRKVVAFGVLFLLTAQPWAGEPSGIRHLAVENEEGVYRVRFEAEREVWFILQDVFQQYIQREVQTTLRTVRRAEEQAPADARERDHIQALRETYEDVEEIVQLASEYSAAELREALETYER